MTTKYEEVLLPFGSRILTAKVLYIDNIAQPLDGAVESFLGRAFSRFEVAETVMGAVFADGEPLDSAKMDEAVALLRAHFKKG